MSLKEKRNSCISDNKLPAWKVILNLITFSPGYYFINFASMIILCLAAMVPTFILSRFFEQLEAGGTIQIRLIALMLFSSEMIGCLGVYGIMRSNGPFWNYTMVLLRKNMLSHILKRPGASALPDSPGEAISRFRGDVFELPLFALWLNDFWGVLCMTIIALVFMIRISPVITLFAIFPVLLIGFISNFATNRIGKYRKESRAAAGRVTGFIGEIFGSVQAVKSSTSEKSIIRQFVKLNETRKKLSIRDRLFNEILHSLFHNSANLGVGVMLIFTGRAIRNGDFSVGSLVLFVFFLEFITEFTTFTGLLAARYKQIGISVERMCRLMNGSKDRNALIRHSKVYIRDNVPPIAEVVRTEKDILNNLSVVDLNFRYPDSVKGIENICFELKRGSFTVIAGRVGSGKTTLLRTLQGLLPKDGGNIYWNSEEVIKADDFFIPPRSAYTSQIPKLFSDSIRNNILMGRSYSDSQIMTAAETAIFDYDLGLMDEGLDTEIGTKGVQISGGQKQRTAATRMFVRKPELYIFDDLSSALDVNTEMQLWDKVFDGGESTCLAVSNRKTALTRADKIIVLKDGKIEKTGRLEELLQESEEMRFIYYGKDHIKSEAGV